MIIQNLKHHDASNLSKDHQKTQWEMYIYIYTRYYMGLVLDLSFSNSLNYWPHSLCLSICCAWAYILGSCQCNISLVLDIYNHNLEFLGHLGSWTCIIRANIQKEMST